MKKKLFILIFALASFSADYQLSACSDVFNYGLVFSFTMSGRNLDCDVTLDPAVVNYPAGTEWSTTDSDGKPISLGKTKYGFTGVQVLKKDKKLVDGMNTEGMSAALLWMEDAQFPPKAMGNASVAMSDLVGWLLGNFKDVEEARKGLAGKKVWFDFALPYPAHLVLHDPGHYTSLVVEWIDGSVKPVYIDASNGYKGVLADGPDYKRQLENLANYKDLNREPDQMTGLPGDMTSMSRFSRLYVLLQSMDLIVNPKNALICYATLDYSVIDGPRWWIQMLLQLLGRVAIVHGESVHGDGDGTYYTHTQMMIIRDHVNKKFYYRFNTELALKMVLAGKSSKSDAPQVVDSSFAPTPSLQQKPSMPDATAVPCMEPEKKSLALDVKFKSADTAAGRYVFAKTREGGILVWSSGGAWAKALGGRLEPVASDSSGTVRVVLSDDFLAANPGTKIFAGCGKSDIEMLAAGGFSEIFNTPEAAMLGKLPEIKEALSSP